MSIGRLKDDMVQSLKDSVIPNPDQIEQWGLAVNNEAQALIDKPGSLEDLFGPYVRPVFVAARGYIRSQVTNNTVQAELRRQIAAQLHSIVRAITEPNILRYMLWHIVQNFDSPTSINDQLCWEVTALAMLQVHPQSLTPILYATDVDVKEVWLRWGMDKDGKNLLHQITLRCSTLILKMFLDNITQLHEDRELVTKLIRWKQGADYIFDMAVTSMNFDTVKLLLDRDKNLLNDCYAEGKKSPLHLLITEIAEGKRIQSQDCCAILELIVTADPIKALTTSYKGLDLLDGGSHALVPYEFASKACARFVEQENNGTRSSSMVTVTARRQTLDDVIRTMEDLMFRHLDSFNIRKASFMKYENAEFSLCDFDFMDSEQQYESFVEFVEGLWNERGKFRLPSRLARLYLPDVSRGGVRNMSQAYSSLFEQALVSFKVVKIFHLSAKDNPNDPVDDDKIADFVAKFEVESLDWFKYNLDIEPLTRKSTPERPLCLRSLTLYSSGNRGCLYHWLSADGLPSLPMLQNVDIVVEASRVDSIGEYVDQLTAKQKTLKDIIRVVPRGDQVELIDISLRPLSLDRRFLDACADAVNKIYPNNSRPEGVTDVKVAVVDSGVRVDKILFNIVKGETSVQNSDGRPAPWYTCKDPHGTHMAMLIKDVNPHCELYAHRIKGGYHELINPNTAEQGIRWALDEKVDIINLSWSFDKQSRTMEDILRRISSNKEPTLVFCAKSDELLAHNVWPADYPETISVAMAPTEQWSTSVGMQADLHLLGDAIVENSRVTGSSASTALASGIASLILTLAKARQVYHWERLKNKERMMRIFRRFKENNQETAYVDPADLFKKIEALVAVINAEVAYPI